MQYRVLLIRYTKYIVLPSLLFIQPAVIQADSFRARIVKMEGQVYVLDRDGEKRQPQKKQYLVNSDETVITEEHSRAVVQFEDGVLSVLDEKSSLRVEQSGWLSQLGGKVYYVFRKVFGRQKSRKVKTKLATIGVRGTTFIVDTSAEVQQVALKQGKLNIESLDNDFEIHKPRNMQDDFAAFKHQATQQQQALQNEYSRYKKNLHKEFVEYKKQFDMQQNTVISIQGNRVDSQQLNQDWEAAFSRYSQFSGELIDAYKTNDQRVFEDEIDNEQW